MKKILYSLIIAIPFIFSIMYFSNLNVYADESKIVTLGADLSAEQKELILNYFGVNEGEVCIITVTNEDEHKLLDDIATQQQIGSRTFSCTYIEPTTSGGIHVKTVNLNWVTCEMIRNALVTSGITNCNVVAASPVQASGTGSLTGIFKAYEEVSGEELSEEKKELASEELITTCEIAGTVGKDEASEMLSNIKAEIITKDISTEEDVLAVIDKYITENNIEITEEQKWKLVELLLKLSKQKYDIEEIKSAYAEVTQTVAEIKEATEKTMNFFEKVWNWITTTWSKLTGKYDEVVASEEYQMIQEQLGILAQTNDSLLGNDTVVTVTENEKLVNALSDAADYTKNAVENVEDKHHWYDWILVIFNSGNNKVQVTEESKEESREESTISFDNFKNEQVEQTEEQVEESDEQPEQTEEQLEESSEQPLLDYVTYDFENNTKEKEETSKQNGGKSFDDITN